MPTFTIYDLETGDVVTSAHFENPADAGRYRESLEAETGRPLCSLVPIDPASDAAHIRLMVDRYRQEVAVTRPMRTATHFIEPGDHVVALCDLNGEVQYMLDGPAALTVAQDVLLYMDSPYRCDHLYAAIVRHPSTRVVWSAYPMHFAPAWCSMRATVAVSTTAARR